MEIAQGNLTNIDSRQKLSWSGGGIPMETGWLYKLYPPLARKQFLKNLSRIISSSLNVQDKAQLCTELGLRTVREDACRFIKEEAKYKFSFKYALNGWCYVFVDPFCFNYLLADRLVGPVLVLSCNLDS